MNRAAFLSLLVVALLGAGCASERPARKAPLTGPSPEFITNDFASFEVVDVDYAAYDRADAPFWVPEVATGISARVFRAIDGHQVFLRFRAPVAAILATCGGHCSPINRLSGPPPELWPTRAELETPRWFPELDLSMGQAWLSVTAEPYFARVGEAEVACGHKNARGVLVHHDPATSMTTVTDFALQWHRTGCGG